MPNVSIILPTYNGAKYICQSIDSIINQTYSDWELIIVNDCSLDNTIDIINDYAKKDQRIHVLSNDVNKRLPESLNIGFRLSKGKYLTWTSDDNMYHSDAIENMVDYLNVNQDIKMVCAKINYISENGKHERISEPYINDMMTVGNRVGACFLYRRCILEEVGEYNTDLFLVEDYDYWLRIYFKYGKIGFINRILYDYRMHCNSLTATRYLDVQKNNARMKAMYVTKICECLADKPEYLCRIYFHISHFFEMSDLNADLFKKNVSVLNMVNDGVVGEDYIVYGAGKIGALFSKKEYNKIRFFTDKDQGKVGTIYCDKKVISINHMLDIHDSYEIVVAVGIEKIYDVLITLNELGIKRCSIYQEEW